MNLGLQIMTLCLNSLLLLVFLGAWSGFEKIPNDDMVVPSFFARVLGIGLFLLNMLLLIWIAS